MEEREDPLAKAKRLGNPAPAAADTTTTATVFLGPSDTSDDPKFNLGWSVTNPQSDDDFIALYSSTSAEDSDYLRNQWQWTNDGKDNPYTTGTDVTQGYEARYLIKNSSGDYYSIARSGAYMFPTISGSGSS